MSRSKANAKAYERMEKRDKAIQKNVDKKMEKYNKCVDVLRKHNKDLETITKDELTKTEYRIIIDYLLQQSSHALQLYPNLM